jgi:hypothetical protein
MTCCSPLGSCVFTPPLRMLSASVHHCSRCSPSP